MRKMDKYRVLRLINAYEKKSKGPEQGSEEWLRIRQPHAGKKRGRVGGSEIGSLMGKNFFKSPNDVMKEKLGRVKPKIPETIHCYFGILFEEVAVLCFENLFRTKVLCKDISVIDSNIENFIFSPDGICPMPINAEGRVVLEADIEKKYEYVPVLVEIKCPLTRPVITNKEIPASYMSQIQAGLICIDIVHAGIFIDNCFRVCSSTDVNTLYSYNKILHASHKTPVIEEQKIGRILVYGELPHGLGIRSNNNIIDFGGASHDTLLKLLLNVRSPKLFFKYEEPHEPGTLDITIHDDYKKDAESRPLIGVIYWKLFKSSYTIVYQDKLLKEEIIKTMTDFNQGNYDNLFFINDENPLPYVSIKARRNV